MRKPELWRTQLTRDLNLHARTGAHGALPLPAGRLLDVELILTLLADYLPEVDPQYGWTVVNGQPFPALADRPASTQRAIAIARLRLSRSMGRGSWDQSLATYRTLPPGYPLYQIDQAGIHPVATAIVPERRAAMQQALQTPPDWATRPTRYAQPGYHRFYIEREAQEVEIPRRLTREDGHNLPLGTSQCSPRPAISTNLAELQDTAAWMDRHLSGTEPAGRWTNTMRQIRLAAVEAIGLAERDSLRLEGLLHLVGMVGSGKSTLFTVLAVHLARQGYRVVLVYGDVATILRDQALFETLRQGDAAVHAVPLIGRSARVTHLNRLHVLEARRGSGWLDDSHPGFKMLSTVCPLDGLRRDVAPIPPGKEPCTRLVPRGTEEEGPSRLRDCPLLPVCPVHRPTRELAEARIWLATPASLLASGPQAPLVPEELRYAEAVLRYADVVLVDEADMVQVQFDNRFAQMEVLVGREDSWMDRLYTQVARQVYRPGRPLIGRGGGGFDRWLTMHNNAQRAVNRLYWWIRSSLDTRSWLKPGYFQGQRLLQRVEKDLGDQHGDTERFHEASEAFLRNTLRAGQGRSERSPIPAAWLMALQAELNEADSETALAELESWFAASWGPDAPPTPTQIAELAHHLLIALLVGALEQALQDVIGEWDAAREVLDLDQGSGGLFNPPSEELVRLVPEPPMGAVVGFQYFDAENNGEGELRFFHVQGMGRTLLYRLHEALQTSDGIAGPHVVLTSGTSWAPGSWKYHIPITPQLVLLPQRVEETGETEFLIEPLTDPENPQRPLSVSGQKSGDRLRNLRVMVRELAKKRGFGPQAMSLLERELAGLPEGRQRILLVVGNYDEAAIVAEALAGALGTAPGEDVVALVPNAEGELESTRVPGTLPRGLLAEFPTRTARFLVAPLQAVERGHNILVGQIAAIGSVYFLVRPYPVPGDPYTAIQKMNAWATGYVPTLIGMDPGTAGMTLRQEARPRWDYALADEDTYSGAPDRTGLLWTQLVLVWQCIGRLLRGGVKARVHFIDAKWAEVYTGLRSGDSDTEATSMLIGFARILQEAFTDPNLVHRAIAQKLYGPFAQALARLALKGMPHD